MVPVNAFHLVGNLGLAVPSRVKGAITRGAPDSGFHYLARYREIGSEIINYLAG